jgi:two-component system, OmpR family, phosphate regulon sensor histidine kinase PhoR
MAGQLRLTQEPLCVDECLVRELRRMCLTLGDEAFLRQLFLIFLDNAIKYSGSGTSIKVRLAKDGRAIRVNFEDQAIGISAKYLPSIFERFYRAGSSSNGGPHQSGGLQLAIARAVVEVLGGSVDYQSTMGSGSIFTVTLPGTAMHVAQPA